LTSCGSSNSQSIQYTTLNYPGPNSTTTTGLTGIRGVANSNDVYITGSYYDGSANQGTLYVGAITGGGTYDVYTYPGASGGNVYSADNGEAGNVKLTGTYALADTGMKAYGFYYNGPIPDGGAAFWHEIYFPDALAPGPVLNTYPHSIMGDLIVGNYNTPITGGNAFLYQISTGTYTTLVKPGSHYTTAYGVWWNGGTSYTIAGGYSDVDQNTSSEDQLQLSTGFIVDYDLATGTYSNWTPLLFPDATFTHFEGITSDGNGGYNLAASYNDGQVPLASFANLPRSSSGGFDTSHVKWIAVTYPNASVTTADTVYQNSLLGIYTTSGSSSPNGYVGQIPTSWY
jgi:hypothetical protein